MVPYQIFAESAIWNFELNGVGLSRDVDGVCNDRHLAEQRQLVVRQQTIGLVKKKIATYEFFETPVFTLKRQEWC